MIVGAEAQVADTTNLLFAQMAGRCGVNSKRLDFYIHLHILVFVWGSRVEREQVASLAG